MSDALPGYWSELLVGHVWPAGSNVEMIADASTNRRDIGAAWHAFSDRLRQVRLGPLSSQEGVTADAVREAFQRGEETARHVADKNTAKNAGYQSAYHCAAELRAQLRSIAEKGTRRITDLQSSSAPVPLKIGNIVSVVLDCQTQANAKAALYGDNLLNSIQQILDREGINQSARQFAMDRGIDTDRMFGSSNTDTVRNQVQQIFQSSETGTMSGRDSAEASRGSRYSVSPAEFDSPATEFSGRSPDADAQNAGHYSPMHPDTPRNTVPHASVVQPTPALTLPLTPALTSADGGIASASAAATPMAGAPRPNTAVPPPANGIGIRSPVTASSEPRIRASPAPAAPSSAPAAGPTRARGFTAVSRQPAATGGIPASVGVRAAAAAAAAPDSTVKTRLRLLVNSVARSEPRLRWTAAERPDGSTVLVTDVAGGWIPAHVDVPAGVQLCPPTVGDLQTLLGTAVAAADYAPGQTLPPADADRRTPTSSRAFRGLVVDDIGWELSQATKWRDGLPRLAHTLAKAAATRTGVLAAETELLGEHLAEVRRHVLDSYPDKVDASVVGNWQLLAAIHSLVKADAAAASYHFTWFRTLSTERAR